MKKILFVYPSAYDEHGCVVKNRRAGIPSRTLPYLAALTPRHFELRIVDELVDDLDFDQDADLVALTGMAPHVPRAIDIAKEFRTRGITTAIGGVGAFSLQDMVESSETFDSIISGEVEEIWESILDDFDRGQLKPRYENINPPDLTDLPFARFDLLNLKKYIRSFVDRELPMIPVETSRGCPHNCKYCTVTRYFGRKIRYRPVGEVVEEIKHHRAKHLLFTDDNIAVNPRRAEELFLALKPLGIHWFGQFESGAVRNPELLRLAYESGCRTAFVGVESLDSSNLASVGKSQNAKLDIKDIVNGFHDAGIVLLASLIFGLDNDTNELIDYTIEQMIATGVDTIFPWMITPIPGTPFYEDYEREGRILHKNYSLYNGVHAVIRPKNISPEDLEQSFWRGLRRFYSFRALIPRVLRAKRNRMGELLFNLHVHRQVHRGLHPFSGIPA